ncbi:MAG: signal recognition particle-docking protein FtsY [Armatimonadetes bacterium]|nr:signal recognition particle-docking protein FtsY [Armatimonadota bacterium]NOG38862.1 signal recognition particle-docking protein FtsY [Armatimonadota bacterium]GIK31279.1 MAG: signal recognition particle-docking protein FtsY [Armatimonadota bacterium]
MFRKLMGTVDRLLGRGKVDEQFFEELEEALLQADTHLSTAQSILSELRKCVREERVEESDALKERLKQAIARRFSQVEKGLAVADEGPTVYLFVGVNGVGKTTTIGKLAHVLRRKGFSVLLAAGDTFRAAAIEQLEIWAKRTDSDIVRAVPNADPGAVVFDAITAAKSRGIDFVLADTAGRQHSKANLMGELAKIAKVTEKALGRPPDEVLLVLDANTGQNAIRQAEEFLKHAGVTGLVLTKLDGTSRGGALIGVYDRFKVPIKLIGVGERPEDLKDFSAEQFAQNLF